MKVLLCGDVVGDPGRKAIEHFVPRMKMGNEIDFAIANCENASGGAGLTPQAAQEIIDFGVDVITSGDHIWRFREIYDFMEECDRLVRPINYPKGVPGRGWTIVESALGIKVAVLNAIGRVFLATVDCPFERLLDQIEVIREQTPIIIVDFHAEATSEKIAMGHFLKGKISALVGTHTHVQTADECIYPEGTAYITDLGMVGPFDSVLGREIDSVIYKFRTQTPTRFPVAKKDVRLCGVIIEIDEQTGKAVSITRVQKSM
ncbi:MAG: TIGR00282 family metallophosphoesterase [Chlamydiota bacterium]|nr:TIGR00282 family metallophosphoesterase [Chlamydiota bacterium]